MTSWSDWKDDEKLDATLRSLVVISPKHKEIFGLACRDLSDYERSLWTLDRGFWHNEIFRINKDTLIDPVFEAVHAEVKGPGK